ncbi:MAG: CHAT domain-containing protein, partial [Ferruginibacter sp.]
ILNLGLLYTATQQYKKADSLFKSEIMLLNNSGLKYSYTMQQSVVGLCKNLISDKKFDEAIDSLILICRLTYTIMEKNFVGLSETEKMKYENELNEIFDLIYTSVYNKKNISGNTLSEIYSLELKRKVWILNGELSILKKARSSHDASFLKLYNSWVTNGQMMAKQYSLAAGERLLNVDSLERINELLEKQISAQNTEPAKKIRQFKMSLANSIIANVDFIRFTFKHTDENKDSAFYAAFILSNKDSFPSFIRLCSEKQLIKLMKNKKDEWINENQLTQNLYSGSSKGKQFYKMVWRPIEPYLTGIKTINYSTSGLLNNVAFQAIYNGKNYLVDHYVFRRFFNLNNTGNNFTAFGKPQSISIWGNMNYDIASYSPASYLNKATNYDSSFSAIPKYLAATSSTKNLSRERLQSFKTHEVAALKKIFTTENIKVNINEGKHATEENFKSDASNIKGVLHISTHGFYTRLDTSKTNASSPNDFISGIQNPLFRCGLALSGVNFYWLKGHPKGGHDDGILTGYEISQLDLSKVQLVTLSACETGLGDVTGNEGNLGLQRAFKLAGVKTMLLSLWQVPAKQTSELLSLFYKNWLKGQTLSLSLKNAELVMEKKYPPYFWAGFVLIE